MINYRYEINKTESKEEGVYWEVSIYANSDLLKQYLTCNTKNEAELYALGFLSGIKMGRGE